MQKSQDHPDRSSTAICYIPCRSSSRNPESVTSQTLDTKHDKLGTQGCIGGSVHDESAVGSSWKLIRCDARASGYVVGSHNPVIQSATVRGRRCIQVTRHESEVGWASPVVQSGVGFQYCFRRRAHAAGCAETRAGNIQVSGQGWRCLRQSWEGFFQAFVIVSQSHRRRPSKLSNQAIRQADPS